MDWMQETLMKTRTDQAIIEAMAEAAQLMREAGIGFHAVCSLIGGAMLAIGESTEFVERVLKRIEADDHD